MATDEFTCDVCGGTFPKDWTDEEALEELEEVWDAPPEECAIVCDECYKKMLQ